ncbi:MAG: T9SS type A sorting domain-containing protein [Candidatus Zixiibacteriota bacterium]|jgi:hypothetical protein
MKGLITIAAVAMLVAAASWGADAKYGGAPYYVDGNANDIHDIGLYFAEMHGNLWAGNSTDGTGFYPGENGVATLYASDFWVGTMISGTPRVSGGIKGAEWHNASPLIWSDGAAWSSRPAYVEKRGDLDSFLAANDSEAGENGPIPVRVAQHGMQWSDAANDDYILFHYRIINRRSASLNPAYLCVLYDFDIGGPNSYEDDKIEVDATRKMPYMYDETSGHPYVGVYVVNGQPSAGGSGPGWNSDADQWNVMTSGEWYEDTTPGDYRAFVSCGPYVIPRNDKMSIGVAVVAGATLAELQANADAAYAKYWEINTGLTEFAARPTSRGVAVEWTPDRPYAGYNVYRAEGDCADFAKLNGAAITGEPPFTYVDAAVEASRTYSYKLEVLTLGGTSEWYGPVEVTTAGLAKKSFAVRGPTPNPVRGRANFAVTTADSGPVLLEAYDLSGRRVASTNVNCTPGGTSVSLDVAALPAGVYIYRASAAGDTASGKMVVSR